MLQMLLSEHLFSWPVQMLSLLMSILFYFYVITFINTFYYYYYYFSSIIIITFLLLLLLFITFLNISSLYLKIKWPKSEEKKRGR